LAVDGSQQDWSPNGRWILFQSKQNPENSGNVWLVHPNGTGLHAVTHTPPGTGKWLSGSFSPNGLRTVNSFIPGQGAAGNADLYAANIDGSGLTNLTRSNPWESAVDWGPRPR
jgi:WD40-like Beta Propeller Repeat